MQMEVILGRNAQKLDITGLSRANGSYSYQSYNPRLP